VQLFKYVKYVNIIVVIFIP